MDKPQNSVGGATGLQGDGVPHFVAYVDVHFVSHAQGQIHSLLPAGLRAHNHPVLVLGGQAELGTPLRDLEIEQSLNAVHLPHSTEHLDGAWTIIPHQTFT